LDKNVAPLSNAGANIAFKGNFSIYV